MVVWAWPNGADLAPEALYALAAVETADIRVASPAPTHGVQTVAIASWNTTQLPLRAAAMSTDCSWNDMTLDHSPGDGGAKK